MSAPTSGSTNVTNTPAAAAAGAFATSHVIIPATSWTAATFVRANHKYPTRRPRP